MHRQTPSTPPIPATPYAAPIPTPCLPVTPPATNHKGDVHHPSAANLPNTDTRPTKGPTTPRARTSATPNQLVTHRRHTTHSPRTRRTRKERQT